MKGGFAESKFVSIFQDARLACAETDGLVDDRAIDRAEIFDEEGIAFAPDARMAARDFCLRVEF